ncbi:MAG: thiamine-phosphate kinase [Verrucomicrobiota bacterium]
MEDEGVSLSNLGEEGLLRRLLTGLPSHPDLLVGPGDDCAVLATPDPSTVYLWKTDAVMSGSHFLPTDLPERVGWKAAARLVSDFAAMGGGIPEHLLISLFARADVSPAWLEGVYAGISRCAQTYGFSIAGGETSLLPPGGPLALFSLSLFGRLPKQDLILRSTAQIGDDLWVTGALGGSFPSGRHLDFTPPLQVAQTIVRKATLSSMMDLSDGLAKDLPRLAQASQVGFQLFLEELPKHPEVTTEGALTDGEDYELLFTAPLSERDRLAPYAKRIGTMVPVEESDSLEGGWDSVCQQ